MVQSMGELFKGMLISANQEQERGQIPRPSEQHHAPPHPLTVIRDDPPRPYQPIVGSVGMNTNDLNHNHGYQASTQSQQSNPSQSYQPRQNHPPQDNRYQNQYQNQSYGGNQYGNYYQSRRSRDICFRCGQHGHRSFECSSPIPLPREEQERLRAAQQQIQGTLDARSGNAPGVGATCMVPQTVACVEVTDEELGLLQDTALPGTYLMSAKMVEVVQQDDKIAKMSAYLDELTEEERACLVVAMAEKRMRSPEEGEPEEAPQAQRPRVEKAAPPSQGTRSKTRAAQNVPSEQYQLPPALRPIPPPASPAQPSVPETMTVDPPEAQPISAPQWQPFVPDPRFEDPANWDPAFMPPIFEPSAAGKKKKVTKPRNQVTGPPKPPRHIKMMKDKAIWDPVETLRKMPVTGLDFGSLLDWSPGIRIILGKAMQLEPDELRKQTNPPSKTSNRKNDKAVCAVQSLVRERESMVLAQYEGVLPEPTIRVFNFHTNGAVWSVWGQGTGYRIGKILIDGGAVVNLMPEKVARKLGLTLQENDDIVIRTATNEIRSIRYCTFFDIDIAGVVAHIRAYVMDIPQSYSLLLGRKWLYQVKAIGDYARNIYTIHDTEGYPHIIAAAFDPINDSPEVMLNPQKQGEQSELTEWEREGINLGRDRMQAIITKLVEDAGEQSKDWIDPCAGSGSDFDEEEFREDDSVSNGEMIENSIIQECDEKHDDESEDDEEFVMLNTGKTFGGALILSGKAWQQ